MKKITTFGFALGIAVVSAGAATAQVKFGVGGPITGPSAATGAQMKNGVDQAAADINAAGGILGQKISVSYGDDVSDPKQGVSVANKFSADGVKFVIGHYNSGVTIPSSEVYQENGVLQITPASTNPTVTERKMWNIFRVCGRDDQQGQVAGEYIVKHFKGKKIAVVHDKTTYGKGLADEMKKTINKAGMKEVLYEGVNTGEKDYSALVSKIKQSGADLIYWGGLYTEGGLIVRQMRDQGVKAPLMGGDGITSDEFASIGGPGVEGTLMTYGPDPRNKRMPKKWSRNSAPRNSSRKLTRSIAMLACRSSSRLRKPQSRSTPRRSPRRCTQACSSRPCSAISPTTRRATSQNSTM